jgi:hypothetical protein
MSNKKIYIQELEKILGSFSFYIWKPVETNDKEDKVDYIHFKLMSDDLTKEHNESISIAGDLKFVFSINVITDLHGKKYLFIKTVNLRKLIELKDLYETKLTEINIYLDYVNAKINKYDC